MAECNIKLILRYTVNHIKFFYKFYTTLCNVNLYIKKKYLLYPVLPDTKIIKKVFNKLKLYLMNNIIVNQLKGFCYIREWFGE